MMAAAMAQLRIDFEIEAGVLRSFLATAQESLLKKENALSVQ